MIIYEHGDIFSSPAEILVCPVNTVGVMGAGLALEFKKKYPNLLEMYQSFCENKYITLYHPVVLSDHNWGKIIMLFPTKKHWKDPSELSYIKIGLETIFDYEYLYPLILKNRTMAFPKLGCGLGGLDWDEVRPIMEHYLNKHPSTVYIYI